MAELVAAIATYALWLYLLLGLLMARELRAMWRAGAERDRSAFGLEREAAASRAVRALITLLLLVTIAAGVYTVANVIAPTLPAAELERLTPAPIIEEPPPMPLATDTPTPAATATTHLPRIVTATPDSGPGPTVHPPDTGLCRNPAIQIDAPAAGTVLTGPVPVVVTVRFDPASGQRFRLRLGAGDNPAVWLPLGDPHAEPVTSGAIETLDPSGRAPGLYSLRLELAAPGGSVGHADTCTVPVRVP
jgi:hypothetical protein